MKSLMIFFFNLIMIIIIINIKNIIMNRKHHSYRVIKAIVYSHLKTVTKTVTGLLPAGDTFKLIVSSFPLLTVATSMFS